MKRLVMLSLAAFALAALAQDRPRSPVRESDVAPGSAHYTLAMDGGCDLSYSLTAASAAALEAQGVAPSQTTRRVRAAQCNTPIADALRAARLDYGVGDGGKP